MKKRSDIFEIRSQSENRLPRVIFIGSWVQSRVGNAIFISVFKKWIFFFFCSQFVLIIVYNQSKSDKNRKSIFLIEILKMNDSIKNIFQIIITPKTFLLKNVHIYMYMKTTQKPDDRKNFKTESGKIPILYPSLKLLLFRTFAKDLQKRFCQSQISSIQDHLQIDEFQDQNRLNHILSISRIN